MHLFITPAQIKVLTWIDSGERLDAVEDVHQPLLDMDLIAVDRSGSIGMTGLGARVVEDFYRGAFNEAERHVGETVLMFCA